MQTFNPYTQPYGVTPPEDPALIARDLAAAANIRRRAQTRPAAPARRTPAPMIAAAAVGAAAGFTAGIVAGIRIATEWW